ASFRLGIPWRHPLTWSDYRLEGNLAGADLVVEGVPLRSVDTAVVYTGGQLRLERLTVTLWDTAANQPGGTLTGTANLAVRSQGDFTARLSFVDINATELARLVPALPPIRGGRITGTVEAQAPFDRIKDPAAWRASGQLAIDRFTVADLPPAQIAARFQLDGGNLAVNDLTANIGGTKLRGDIRADGRAPYAFQIQLQQATGQLAEWGGLVRQLGIDTPPTGAFTAGGTIRGTLDPFAASATGTVDLENLAFRGAHVDSVHVEFAGDRRQLNVTRIAVRLYQGTASGSASVSLDSKPSGRLDINWQAVRAGQLLGDVLPQAQGAAGVSRGNLSVVIPAGEIGSPAMWQASGSATIDRLAIRGMAIRQASAAFELQNQSLSILRLRAEFSGGRFQATARVALAAPLSATATFSLQDFDLSQLAAPLELKPTDLAGRLNASGTAKGNLADLGVSALLTGTADNASLLGVRLDALRFRVAASRYGLALKDINVRLYGGTLRGTGVLPFDTRVAGDADLAWSGIDVGRAAADFALAGGPLLRQAMAAQPLLRNVLSHQPLSGQSLSGLAGGTLNLKLALGHDLDWHKLIGTAHLDIARLVGLGIQNGRIAVDAALANDTLTVSKCNLRASGFRAAANARVALTAPFDFAGKLSARGKFQNLPLAEMIAAGEPVSGDFTLDAKLRGTANPLAVAGDGTVAVRSLQIGKAKLESLDAEFVADRQSIALRRLDASFYGGSLQGSAVVPLAGQAAGEAALHLKQLDVGRLAADLARIPVRLNAVTTADLDVQIPAGTLADPQQWTVRATADIPSLAVNGLPVGDLHATANGRHDTLDYRLDGHLIGGLVQAGGRWSADQDAAANAGLVELKELQLARLVAAFPRSRQLQGLAGTVDLKIPFTLPAKFAWPTGRGELKLGDLRYQRIQISDRLDGRLTLDHGILKLERFEGTLAQGIVRASCSIDLGQPRRSRVRATLSGVNGEQLLAPWPEMKGVFAGPIDLDLRGVLARPWRFVATLGIEDGKVLSVPLTGFRLPLRIDVDPRTLAAEVDADDGAGQFGHGRVQLRLRLRSTNTTAVDLTASLTDGDLGPLLSSQSFGQLAGGRVSGTITLSGQNVRSLNDLSGSVKASLRNLQVTALPVMQNLEPYLSGGLASAGSNDGDLRARIGAGVLQLERLTVNTSSARLYASGRVSMAGNLDLGVAVSSYPLPGGALAPALLARLPLAAAAGPVGLLITANELLANRVIYLDVTGTVSSPAVRVRPLPLLTTEATRFFLGGGL
ncbi:MAG TPA: AsmA-like C-terminal region-containing protein, partial [Pirellulales bacterium]